MQFPCRFLYIQKMQSFLAIWRFFIVITAEKDPQSEYLFRLWILLIKRNAGQLFLTNALLFSESFSIM
jgi:hypothetical protein